jgi:Domain of unknown function (DUF4218)
LIHTCGGQKDTTAVRKDMEAEGVHAHLWMKPHPNQKKDHFLKPKAPYVMSNQELQQFLLTLKSLKYPTGFGSSLAKCVRASNKLAGMKSHDYHCLMQQILPLALKDLMATGPRLAIVSVCQIWQKVCCKVWGPATKNELMKDVADTLCALEMHFPASFFDVMTHLMIHIVEELDICGPVSQRWMCPIERYLKNLKGFVRNKASPEASMAEGYILEEALGFVTEYMVDCQVTRRRIWDSDQEEGVNGVVFEGAQSSILLSVEDRDATHIYYLQNNVLVASWLRCKKPSCGNISFVVSFPKLN